MAKVEIYTTPVCPFCKKAKALLDGKGITYNEIDVYTNPTKKTEMMERAQGRRTVPQIFINGQGIGGCDDLHDLDAKGELDPLLAA